MNDREIGFRFELSPVELHWLAGVLGLSRLPLPDDPLRFMPISRREPALQKAAASLQSRGLIQPASEGYQVDRLPAAILKWLGSAAEMLILDVHTRDGSSRHSQVFTEADASMSVSLAEGSYQFLFLPDHNAVSDYLLDQAGASFADPKGTAAKFALSQPVTILRAAWSDPALAVKMLKVTGIRQKEARALLAWAESLEWVVALNHVKIAGDEAGEEQKAILCGDGQRSWAGRMNGEPEEAVTFAPVDLDAARALIRNLL